MSAPYVLTKQGWKRDYGLSSLSSCSDFSVPDEVKEEAAKPCPSYLQPIRFQYDFFDSGVPLVTERGCIKNCWEYGKTSSVPSIIAPRIHFIPSPVRPVNINLDDEDATLLAWILGILGAVFCFTWLIAIIAGSSSD